MYRSRWQVRRARWHMRRLRWQVRRLRWNVQRSRWNAQRGRWECNGAVGTLQWSRWNMQRSRSNMQRSRWNVQRSRCVLHGDRRELRRHRSCFADRTLVWVERGNTGEIEPLPSSGLPGVEGAPVTRFSLVGRRFQQGAHLGSLGCLDQRGLVLAELGAGRDEEADDVEVVLVDRSVDQGEATRCNVGIGTGLEQDLAHLEISRARRLRERRHAVLVD